MQASVPLFPKFSLEDGPPDDGVTLQRTETKFMFVNADVRKLDAMLAVNNRRVVYAGGESLVSSVYFDNCGLSSFRDNLAGVGTRFKLRLRWYDSNLPAHSAFFEIKRRENRFTMKKRYAVTSSALLGQMSFHEMITELLRLLPEEPRELLRAHPLPVVLVRYRRRHYHARDPLLPARLTLDHGIAGVGQMGCRRIYTRFFMPLFDRTVLEIKSAVDIEKHIPYLLYPLRPRLSRFSKYVLCCSLMGLATGVDELLT